MSDVMTQNGHRAALSMSAYEPVDVDLWGHEFVTVPATRSVNKQAEPLIEKIEKAELDADEDTIIALYGEVLDLRLKPKGNGRKKPSTLLKEKWEADALTMAQATAFLQGLGLADRPT